MSFSRAVRHEDTTAHVSHVRRLDRNKNLPSPPLLARPLSQPPLNVRESQILDDEDVPQSPYSASQRGLHDYWVDSHPSPPSRSQWTPHDDIEDAGFSPHPSIHGPALDSDDEDQIYNDYAG
ncbi:hypothetical protein C8J57DRAFT_1494281 [Mycena rebaudengoi]|nr:hypothetical protein C8J57DRAFT_1494281 [Mycena rebaudengoi]